MSSACAAARRSASFNRSLLRLAGEVMNEGMKLQVAEIRDVSFLHR